LLLFVLARYTFRERGFALLPALLFLLSFAVPNYVLAGLVDSGELLVLLILVWCLRRNRWHWLPWLGIVGTLAKETFGPVSVAFAAGWIAAQARDERFESLRPRLTWLALLAATALGTLIALFSIGNGRLV